MSSIGKTSFSLNEFEVILVFQDVPQGCLVQNFMELYNFVPF